MTKAEILSKFKPLSSGGYWISGKFVEERENQLIFTFDVRSSSSSLDEKDGVMDEIRKITGISPELIRSDCYCDVFEFVIK